MFSLLQDHGWHVQQPQPAPLGCGTQRLQKIAGPNLLRFRLAVRSNWISQPTFRPLVAVRAHCQQKVLHSYREGAKCARQWYEVLSYADAVGTVSGPRCHFHSWKWGFWKMLPTEVLRSLRYFLLLFCVFLCCLLTRDRFRDGPRASPQPPWRTSNRNGEGGLD